MDITIFTGQDYEGETWARVYDGHLSREQVESMVKNLVGTGGYEDYSFDDYHGGYYAEYYTERAPSERREKPAEQAEDDWQDEFGESFREAESWVHIFLTNTHAPPAINPMEEIARNINELR